MRLKNPLADDDWLRLAGIKDLQPGEMSADAEDDDYLDEDEMPTEKHYAGSASRHHGHCWFGNLVTGQKKLVELFDTGEVRAFHQVS